LAGRLATRLTKDWVSSSTAPTTEMAKKKNCSREQGGTSPERDNKEDGNRSISQDVLDFVKTTYLQSLRHHILRNVSKQENSRNEKNCNCQSLEIESWLSHWLLAIAQMLETFNNFRSFLDLT